jgi:hypothetical protein
LKVAKKMLGNVESLGLGDFGQARHLSPIWGTLIGGGTAGLTKMLVEHNTTGTTQVNADVIGLGVGLATAGVMATMKSTREAAIGAAIGAFLAAGLSWLNRVVLGTVALPASTAAVASAVAAAATPTPAGGAIGPTPPMSGLGLSTARSLQGLGIARANALNGLGLSTTAVRPVPHGTIPGVAGPRLTRGGSPVSLLGPAHSSGFTPGAAQVQLMGGPQIHGLANQYGATHFSR